MQKILDELQNDIDNELEKVSLERLADINPDLLSNIKQAAEDAFLGGQSTSGGGNSSGDAGAGQAGGQTQPSFLSEFRSEEMVQQSKAWLKLDLKHAENSKEIIQKLKACVTEGSSAESRYTQSEAIDMTHVLAAASTAADLLSKAVEISGNQGKLSSQSKLPFGNHGSRSGGVAASGFSNVDKSLFTNIGIKKKNLALIGLLYEVGLPFISSSDGRRFKTQLDLSKHLDRLFKKRYADVSRIVAFSLRILLLSDLALLFLSL